MIYEIKTQKYVGFAKRKIDMTYSVNADNIEEAVERLYPQLKNFGWTKASVRGMIKEEHELS